MKYAIITLALFMVMACAPTMEPIEYGSDQCAFCKMNIVDDRYGSELVTSKGKVFKFDAIECLINYREASAEESFAMELVNTFDAPGKLLPAIDCYYLICERLPSPMGAYLTAFQSEQAAENKKADLGGDTFVWTVLPNELDKNGIIRN